MTLVRSVVESINWSRVLVSRGSGLDLKLALLAFVEAEEADMEAMWWGLEGSVFAQNTIYAGSVETVDVMMAALAEDPPPYRRAWVLEVLRFILTGGSITEPDLAERCRARGERGAWLLAAQIRRLDDPADRQPLEEILELVDPALRASISHDLGS